MFFTYANGSRWDSLLLGRCGSVLGPQVLFLQHFCSGDVLARFPVAVMQMVRTLSMHVQEPQSVLKAMSKLLSLWRKKSFCFAVSVMYNEARSGLE